MTSTLIRGVAALAVSIGLMGEAGAAFAQHVVTEDEAGKLTLEALTAPPAPRPVYHVYRASYRIRMRHGGYHGQTVSGRHGLGRHHGYVGAAYHTGSRAHGGVSHRARHVHR